MAITNFETGAGAGTPEGGNGGGFGTVLLIAAIGLAAWFGIKHFTKPPEPEQKEQ